MVETLLGNVIVFFHKIGIYDVVLPFLLIFTIVFAIFEKTKVLGTEKVGEVEYTRKTLNALAAFVIAFLAIASSQIVSAITSISSQVVIVIILVVFFLMSVGVFYGHEEDVSLEKKSGFRTFFMVIVFIAILAIFLQAIKTSDGNSLLEVAIYFLSLAASETWVAAIVLLIGVVLFMWFVVKEPKKTGGETGGGS